MNIRRSLNPKRKRKIVVIYIYQKPEGAWEFTKAREISEGRPVPKYAFID